MEPKNNKPFSYKIGEIFAAMVASCVAAIIIATTVRIISWILF